MITLPNPFSSLLTTAEPSIVCSRCGRDHGCICRRKRTTEEVFNPIEFAELFGNLTEEQIDEIDRREDHVPMSVFMLPEGTPAIFLTVPNHEAPEKPVQRRSNGRVYLPRSG